MILLRIHLGTSSEVFTFIAFTAVSDIKVGVKLLKRVYRSVVSHCFDRKRLYVD